MWPPNVTVLPLISTPLIIEKLVRVEISGPHETFLKNHLIKSINSDGLIAVVYWLSKVIDPTWMTKSGELPLCLLAYSVK
ncbi:hypothetical protein MYMA111404_00245 [Mycoplasma marinum]